MVSAINSAHLAIINTIRSKFSTSRSASNYFPQYVHKVSLTKLSPTEGVHRLSFTVNDKGQILYLSPFANKRRMSHGWKLNAT